MIYYLGIDPGESGAAVLLYDGSTYSPSEVQVDKIFTFKGQSIDEVVAAIEAMGCRHISRIGSVSCALEQLHAYPKRGSIGNFKLGRHYGMLQASLTAFGIDFVEVTPQKWQKALGCLTGGNKNVTKKKAQELFPDVKVTHAIADALLLAEYARRKHVE